MYVVKHYLGPAVKDRAPLAEGKWPGIEPLNELSGYGGRHCAAAAPHFSTHMEIKGTKCRQYRLAVCW